MIDIEDKSVPKETKDKWFPAIEDCTCDCCDSRKAVIMTYPAPNDSSITYHICGICFDEHYPNEKVTQAP